MYATILQPSKKVLGIARRLTNNNKTKFDFVLSNDKGGVDVVKTIYPDRHIRNYYLYSMPNNHVLCNFRDADSTDTKYKSTPFWQYWAMFSPESFNFPVATEDAPRATFSFYPNPANEFITIKSETEYDAIRVYSIEGKMLLQQPRTDETLDVSNLSKGLYFFELWLKEKPITRQEKFVK
jgi:hypothetical protein